MNGAARPFLKIPGGKTLALKQFEKYFPSNYRRYFEPFVGGGAVFFHLKPKNAFISDLNEETINCYLIVRDFVDFLIVMLKKHVYEKDYYYKIREWDRRPNFKQLTDLERASRFIYLNKTCFNGLIRYNKKGQFNAPFGDYTNPKICDEENLRAVSNALQDTEIYCCNYSKILDHVKTTDFIYLDPPYSPISKTSDFTSYTKQGFSKIEQLKLRKVVDHLTIIGCKIMLSNSDNDLIRTLYKKYEIHEIEMPRMINADATKRQKINELLITNY